MIIPLEPTLKGLAERRFLNLARQVLDHQTAGNLREIRALVEGETESARDLGDLQGQCDEYTACVRVLGDLAQLRWKLVETGYGLELHSPRSQGYRGTYPEQARRLKEAIRNELRPRVVQQFAKQNVRRFIRRMERPSVSSNKKSIRELITVGAELQERLRTARQHSADDPKRAQKLRYAVQPYLQLVEPSLRDDHTGIHLRDIWRYFRYTWSIPQTPIPGRNLKYLIRDAAHEGHAVMGIAALNNCAVQVVPRDRAIGWSAPGLLDALKTLFASHRQQAPREARKPTLQWQGVYRWLKKHFRDGVDPSEEAKRAALKDVTHWLIHSVSTAIGEIECQGLATDAEVASPNRMLVERLRHLGMEFASLRRAALEGRGADVNALGAVGSDIRIDDDLFELDAKHPTNAHVHDSRRMLVLKKRALELARLLDALRVIIKHRVALEDPSTTFVTLDREEVRTAINTALTAIKSRRIGTNILEITTCGAVTPYNHILGGKLVALLLLSPQISADNNRRYGQTPTIIRSQLRNSVVVPDSTLVWLSTTSLFAHGSSQYGRLRLPAGVIASDQPEIRYIYLGNTTGYGTIQFADETVRALDSVMRKKRGYRDVNNVFGEGASPRMRKLRSGLDAIGFNATLSMLHHQQRRVYGVPLFDSAGAYLCGLESNVPDYLSKPEAYTDATERIADFWRKRWLSSRLAHADSWVALGETRRRLLSSTIPVAEPPPISGATINSPSGGGAGDDDDRLKFWHRLANAGSNAVSEGLTNREFDELHIETPLEQYLYERADDGCSIILTGNAGDGKTHLARALRRRIEDAADRFEFAMDATAMMNSREDVMPVIERWRKAKNARKGLVLAINQYPLYLLRSKLRSTLPDVSDEIERQWKTRLTTALGGGEVPFASLILVDLSLRNPLSRDFSERVLRKMLNDPVLRRHAESSVDPDFSLNFASLNNEDVQERIFGLYDRVISSGRRTTVRELWILTARLLFGTNREKEPPGSHNVWYSERLFAHDRRFPLCRALQDTADPASISHPHIDRRLEEPRGTQPAEWHLGGEPPLPLPSPASVQGPQARVKYHRRFRALKRRFYFEHADGGESIFKLDPSPQSRFHAMLRTPADDADHLSVLLKAINWSYCPHNFEGSEDNLYLWIGHRLDEQPTKSFIAGEFITSDRIKICRPEPLGALKRAFAYIPDHLILNVTAPQSPRTSDVALRIDATLFRTLSEMLHGLPRHLINPDELNRLDSFIDRLRCLKPTNLLKFFIYNTEYVTPSMVKLAPNLDTYYEVRQL